ncbi:MAG: ribonuclease HI family protein [Acidimicrobiia bacterium]|nr:MAG: ribonuclease HI family protein [Acidimicrobiia bacterium]
MRGTHVLYCDGASRGNPGLASYGFSLLTPGGEVLVEGGRAIGVATNNVAEYRGLIAGLEAAIDAGIDDLEVRLDSLLLVKQISGEYRVKAPGLKPLQRQAVGLLARIGSARLRHVPREQNTRADALANAALDGEGLA